MTEKKAKEEDTKLALSGFSPSECQERGLVEVEPVYYSLNTNVKSDHVKGKRGNAYKSRITGNYVFFVSHAGVIYKLGDCIYLEIAKCEPYGIGLIVGFKMVKRDQITVRVLRFFRPHDVPCESYAILIQGRRDDPNVNQAALAAVEAREIFSTEIRATYPICYLRGKISVRTMKNIRTFSENGIQALNDTFFNFVAFDHNNSRLAPMQGEIRIGDQFQAKVNQFNDEEQCDDSEPDELLWRPGFIADESVNEYIRANRAFRLFSLIKTDGIAELERRPLTSDLCMDESLRTLAECGYSVKDAIESMQKKDENLFKQLNYMSVDDTKKFVRGIRTYGKRFSKIQKELLHHHTRQELVNFYYYWKKHPDATKPKPLSRQRNSIIANHRKNKNNQSKMRVTNSDLADYESASESEMDVLKSDERSSAYACHHCYLSESKDWHHSGEDHLLLCTECRVHYKKYGQLRVVDRPDTVPPSLFKQKSLEVTEEKEHGVRTRAGKKERRNSPTDYDKKCNSTASSVRSTDRQRNGKRKRSRLSSDRVNEIARKRSKETDSNEQTNADGMYRNDEDVTDNLDSECSNASKENDAPDDVQCNSSELCAEQHVFGPPKFEASTENSSKKVDCSNTTDIVAAEQQLPPANNDEKSKSILSPLRIALNETEENNGLLTGLRKNHLCTCDETASTSITSQSSEFHTVAETNAENSWSIGKTLLTIGETSQFIRFIERSGGLSSARTDLIYRPKLTNVLDKKKEAPETVVKNQKNSVRKASESSTVQNGMLHSVSQFSPAIDNYMGGRIPLNGALMGNIPAMLAGHPTDARLAYVTQHQYALALEQHQKQLEQQLRAHQQYEMMRNGANGPITQSSMHDSSTCGTVTTPHGIPTQSSYHGFSFDPRSMPNFMHTGQFGMPFALGMDGHTVAAINAHEQRNAMEQRFLAGMAGMDIFCSPSLSAAQNAAPHLHAHAAAMMQASAAAQSTGDALQLQQMLAMSAAVHAHRPYIDQNQVMQMSMMNSLNNEIATRMVNPGPLNSDMMRRLQHEGGFATAQRP